MDRAEFIALMPKAELHMHLEGSLEPSLAKALATRNNLPLPTAVATASTTSTGWAFHDLSSFLAIYYPAMSVLQTPADFHDLAWQYLQRCRQQNVLHTEMFFDPQAHTSRGVPFANVMQGYRQAMVRAQRELGVSSALVLCFLRDLDAGFAMATLMEALAWREWIVGVGLDSDERGNPPRKFAAVFERARKEGFLVTVHCDVDQPGSLEHIREALEEIRVDRIDHGTNVVEDERLVEMVRERGIGLTCCPLSNSVVTSDFKGKEIVGLLRKGVRVTINSDDPAYFRGYMNENMTKMVEGTDVTDNELVQLQRNAFDVAWISASKRDKFLDLLDEFQRSHTRRA